MGETMPRDSRVLRDSGGCSIFEYPPVMPVLARDCPILAARRFRPRSRLIEDGAERRSDGALVIGVRWVLNNAVRPRQHIDCVLTACPEEHGCDEQQRTQ